MSGNDQNPGTKIRPVRTVSEVNSRLKQKPANIFFEGNLVYNGTLILENLEMNPDQPLVISSSGIKKAVINGADSEAIKIVNCKNISIEHTDIIGNGRKEGNSTNGLSIRESSNINVSGMRASGFQISGIDLFNCHDVRIMDVVAVNNGFSGINVMGSSRDKSGRITIARCRAENNPGDPAITDNHSGNGILVGVSDGVKVEYCSATNNGWDMPRQGNGPVGIWAWESNRVLIRYCLSYRNKTSKGAKDGGGFDLDGGMTNSRIQYCLSFGNQGAGYGLFQYAGASAWKGNSIKNCISINDATTTEGAGSLFIWNGSGASDQLSECEIKNNIIYNDRSPLVSYEEASAHRGFLFHSNLFLGRGTPVSGNKNGSFYRKNIWLNEGKYRTDNTSN